MRIGFDASPFQLDWIEGMHVYNEQLLGHLSDLYPDLDFTAFFFSLRARVASVTLPTAPARTRRVRVPVPHVLPESLELRLRFDLGLPMAARHAGIDLFHALRYHAPPRTRIPTVTTFHDVFAVTHPELLDQSLIPLRLTQYRRAIERSTLIIAVSGYTRDALLEHYHLPPDRVRVVHEAHRSDFRPLDDADAVARARASLGLPARFVLAVAASHARKDPERPLSAFAQVVAAIDDPELALVFFGGSSALAARWAPRIAELGLTGRVHFRGAVDWSELRALYCCASTFVYSSLVEGFGLPILESFACGTPVITSDCTAMPEIAGGAALLASPNDVAAVADAIVRVLSDESLAALLRARGLARAAEFSWARAAHETRAAYDDALTMTR